MYKALKLYCSTFSKHTQQCISILWHQLQSVWTARELLSKRYISTTLWQFTQCITKTSLCSDHMLKLCSKWCRQLQKMNELAPLFTQCRNTYRYLRISQSSGATSEMLPHILLSNQQSTWWPRVQRVKRRRLWWWHKQSSWLWGAGYWCFTCSR